MLAAITAATPLLLAAIGELVAERAGVLNLGVEGMMAVGAVAAFATASATGSPWAGLVAAALAGTAMAAVFALTAVWFATNQVATGLAVTLTGLGTAGLVGEAFVGRPGVRLPHLDLGLGLSDIPILGPLLFAQDPLFYAALALTAGSAWFLFRTRAGLKLRAVGDRPEAAAALGIKVRLTRTLAVLFGGLTAGLAGAHLTLVYTPQWVDNITAGRGFIALALVVFASWRPGRVVVGATLFGAVTIGQFHAQAIGVSVPSQLLSALPYLTTVLVLVAISLDRRFTMINTPAALGQPFVPER